MKEAKSLLYLLTLQCHYLCEDFPDTLAEHFEPLIETLRVTQKEQVYVLDWVYQGTDQSLTIDQSRFHFYVRGDLGKERPSNLQEKNEERIHLYFRYISFRSYYDLHPTKFTTCKV